MEQRFLLELDGKPAGRLFDFKSGGGKADVVATGFITRKHLDAVKYEDMVLACGTGMSRTFYDWLSSTFRRSYARKRGAVITLDPRSNPIGRLDFWNALVTSLAMPALDAASKDPAHMRITIIPERTSFLASTPSQHLGTYASPIAKSWLTGNFRIQIDGLETDCRHVTKIESVTLGQKTKTFSSGSNRTYEIEPTAITFSDLILELPKQFAGGFVEWFDRSAEGRTSDVDKNGTLDFLAPGTATPYFSVNLKDLRVHHLVTLSAVTVKVGLYCKEIDFSAGSSAVK